MVREVILQTRLDLRRKVICLHVQYYRCADDSVPSRRYHVRHFIAIPFLLSWLGGVPFENGLVLRACERFVEACKRDCGRQDRLVKFRDAILTSRA